ncbi:MAG: phosphatidylserine decarboxylase family protein [Termitinemataceae bacterium]|nr:MAG: phosphatidylserine decarboxylase family protein [Termitinemataceae bacterium]
MEKIVWRHKTRILKEGLPFILCPLALGIVLICLPLTAFCTMNLQTVRIIMIILGIIFVIFAMFCMYFFRDPDITINANENYILSPCNGTVMDIDENSNENIIRVFLSIFNVHSQRSPISGTVKSVEHKDGKFYAAWNPKAESENEQNIITIESNVGIFIVRQIAGLVARRCVSRVKTGDVLTQGQIIGLIKFSSQTDLHLPKNINITVHTGDKVTAGITVMGHLK